MNQITDEEWEKAEKHLIDIIDQYKELIGMPGVNVMFALYHLDITLQRFNQGERSSELYARMLGAK